jgi:UDP-galactopyranose mutase
MEPTVSDTSMDPQLPLLVYSHLRWNSVFQRPQQLMSRLAARRRVLFVEEPVRAPDRAASWERQSVHPGILVCTPHTPIDAPGFHEAQYPALIEMLWNLLAEERIARHVAWLYSPMAWPLANAMAPSLIAYDCMDDLSSFLGAHPALGEHEANLLRGADVAFMGGRSLYEARRHHGPHVHCFPSSVDVEHFQQAQDGSAEPAEQQGLSRPRLGFFGVIDERVDLGLLEQLADARPHWQIVLVGPVAKIDPATLPRRPNLHYMGARRYADLPSFLSGWDVCLLPFARNDATRFISPTKTLEYMAAERPIVSTPITDVAEPYGHIVHLADSADAFVGACERALCGLSESRVLRMRDVLARTSWDETARAMERKLERALRRLERRKEARAAGARTPAVERVEIRPGLRESFS